MHRILLVSKQAIHTVSDLFVFGRPAGLYSSSMSFMLPEAQQHCLRVDDCLVVMVTAAAAAAAAAAPAHADDKCCQELLTWC